MAAVGGAGLSPQRGVSLPLAVVFAALVFGFIVAPAYARTTHFYESAIRGVPSVGPGGSVPYPGGLEEVNSMTAFAGDLYVAEHIEGEPPSTSRTDEFGPSPSEPGKYDFVSQLPPQPEPTAQNRATGIAFGSTAGEPEMYLGQGGFAGAFESTPGLNVFAVGPCGHLECATLQKFWTGEKAPPGFGVGAVAVDHSTSSGDWASGDVFTSGTGTIEIFEPKPGGEEEYVGQVTAPSPELGLGAMAVSGFNGDLIAGAGDGSAVYVFRPEEESAKRGKYALVRQLTLPSGASLTGGAVAVDDSTVGTFAGEIYVATEGGVDEFSPEGVFLGRITGVPREGTFGGVEGQTEEVPLGTSSLAVDSVSHRVFVGVGGTFSGVVDVFGPDAAVPDVVTGAPGNLALETDPKTGSTLWGVQLTGEVNPDEAGDASCSFAWGMTEAFGQEALCGEPVPNGPSPVPVHASLTGLQPDTSYTYRLEAKNNHGPNPGESSQDLTFKTPGPGLHSESVSDVSSTTASFEATVAPHEGPTEEHDLQAATKSPTSYLFQYSTQPTSACVSEPAACSNVPAAPASVGSSTGDVAVSPQDAHGLSPNTTYHYRLVVLSEALPATKPGVLVPFYGADRTFTTQGLGGSVVLPDGRAWELVSPADKDGAQLWPNGSGRAASDGGEFTFVTNIPTESGPPGNPPKGVQVLSTRTTPGDWSSVDIALSSSQPEKLVVEIADRKEYTWFSEDFGSAVAEYIGAFSVPQGSHQNELGEWEQIVETSPVPTEPTPLLRHNTSCGSAPASCYEPLVDSEDVTSGLKPEGKVGFAGASADGSRLYIGSRVQLTTANAPAEALYEWSASRPPAQRLSLMNVTPGGEPLPTGIAAVTPNGSRVVLGCGEGFGAGGCTDLYVRDAASGEVAQMDLEEDGSQPGVHTSGPPVMSSDGSKVFFTFPEPLTSDSEPSGGFYVCELASAPLKCALKDLTPPSGLGQPGEHVQVSSTLGVSGDGSRVYFLAEGVLAAGATPGATNLYVAHEQEGTWTTSFIATPQGIDGEHRVSSDGRLLAFSTQTPLTGYDNRDAKTGQPDSEVYLYDAETGRLACESCNPSGARPTGSSEVPGPQFKPRGFEPTSRALFDTGRLFFDSGDALVPQDANGNTDVYEFEPAGVGDCTSARPTFNTATGGCVGLISSGVASGESVFLDASATGADAFFTTRERLVPQDVDGLLDIYDAHECTTSSPCAPPTEPSEECRSVAACRSAAQPQPSIFGAPSSALFTGLGNLGGGAPNPPAKPKSAAQIRAERLSKALASCRHRYKHQRKRRATCEKQAHKAYGAARKASKAKKSAHANQRTGR